MHRDESDSGADRRVRVTGDGPFISQFKAAVLYPARDILTLDPLRRAFFGGEAADADCGGVADSAFFTERSPDEITPTALARGPNPELVPVQPFTVDKVKVKGASAGFFGTDANGRQYLVKLDHPDYAELGSAATVIVSRLYYALGYNVAPVFVVTLRGTDDPRFDGRRAVASVLVPDVVGHFQYDWFRHRRDVRGLRMVAAWLNDTDRTASNTLVSVRNQTVRYYLIDFNSCLGAWQGAPKEPWRGWRYEWGSTERTVEVLTLGLVRPGFDPAQPVFSPAVGRFDGRFDPMRWRPQVSNTAFDQMTPADRNWIIRRIARIERPHLEAVVAAAELSSPDDGEYLVSTLLARQARIVALLDSEATDGEGR